MKEFVYKKFVTLLKNSFTEFFKNFAKIVKTPILRSDNRRAAQNFLGAGEVS